MSREGSALSSSVEWRQGHDHLGGRGKCCCEEGRKAHGGGQSPEKHGERWLSLGPELFILTSFDRWAR